MSKKYYKDIVGRISSYVWYKLLDGNDNVIKDYSNSPCFRDIYTYHIPENTKAILYFRDKSCVPYDAASVKRWIEDLNEFGFPCSLVDQPTNSFNIRLDLSDYKYKAALLGALALLRGINEEFICKIPDIYFRMVDENPDIDKFDALQNAFKSNELGIYKPTGHMVTYKENGNGKNVTKQTLFKRYEQSGIGVYGGSVTQNDKWQG